jgi:hypothetical protein
VVECRLIVEAKRLYQVVVARYINDRIELRHGVKRGRMRLECLDINDGVVAAIPTIESVNQTGELN